MKIGVIGYGYWGPNIVRNLTDIDSATVKVVCDTNTDALKKAKQKYPYIHFSQNSSDVLRSTDLDAVAIVTPVSTHFELAKQALENGKHIFVEKPFTTTSKEAEQLIELAEKKKLKIMVDHTFVFNSAVRKIKELVDDGTLGELIYYDSTRVSLGLFQHDANVIWDLAPHDFSIIDHLIKNKPIALTAHGADHTGGGKENIAFITIYYEKNLIVHISVNWLSPIKVRHTLIGGAKKMLVWDDLQTDEKIKVYDKGINVSSRETRYRLMVDYRSGDMWSPRVDVQEALKAELMHFVECIQTNRKPMNDGHAGLRVVKMLEMTDQSLKNGGNSVKFKP